MADFVILGPASGPRIDAFQSGLAGLGRPCARLVSYDAFLDNPDRLQSLLNSQTVLRIESPDRDPGSLGGLYAAGAEEAEAAGFAIIDRGAETTKKGFIGSPAQLWFGLRKVLQMAQTSVCSTGARVLGDSNDTVTMFDKSACAQLLQDNQIAVPRQLGQVTGFEQLIASMRAARCSRVFLKLQHGSAAAGMVALAFGPRQQMAAYTTGVVNCGGSVSATRRVQRLTVPRAIQSLVDRLTPLGLIAEQWVPKSGNDGRTYDLRVIMIGGEPIFHIMRQSVHPMTNLHLGGRRAPADAIRRRMGDEHWAALNKTCRQVAGLFAGNLMIGVDVAVLAGERKHAVLEVNAFGDHVKNVYYRGTTPQQCQVLMADRWLAARRLAA